MTEIPEGIPQDVWSAALDIDIDADFGWDGQTTTGLQAERECRLSIARAILAEREEQRERGAKIVEGYKLAIVLDAAPDRASDNAGMAYASPGEHVIAAAIRTPA